MLFLLFLAAALGAPVSHGDLEARFETLLADVYGRDLGGGIEIARVDVQPHRATVFLERPDGSAAGRLVLRHPDRGGRQTPSLAVHLMPSKGNARSEGERQEISALLTVFASIEENDPGDLGTEMSPPPARGWLTAGPVALVGLLLGFIAAVTVGWRDRVKLDIQPNHAVPAVIQLVIYAYWMVYVVAVRERMLDIVAQLLFAYGVEALLMWSRGRTWRISLAPVPVVLSMNLFVWFHEPGLQCVAIALALASKELLLRDGKHIFNPSAFGVAVLAGLTLTLPSLFTWGTPTPDIELNLPPNMAEILLVLTVLAQLRFPIVLVPICATGALLAMRYVGNPPDPWWPATFLILLLFSTDPKTIPKTPLGRCLFGAGLGVGIAMVSGVLQGMHLPDVYGKVVPIPVLNYLAPHLDRLAERIGARADLRFLDPRFNRRHVVAWVIAAIFGISTGKAGAFQNVLVWELGTVGVVQSSPTTLPTCRDNPAWCEPFSFGTEARLWIDRGQSANR